MTGAAPRRDKRRPRGVARRRFLLRRVRRGRRRREGGRVDGVSRVFLRAFASLVKNENAAVFLSVHGGVGEDGTLQAFFETNGVAFTGSGAAASRLCMDKSATGAALAAARLEGVTTCRKVTVTAWEMSEALASAAAAAGGASATDDIRRQGRDPAGAWWARLVASVGGDARDGLCIKPNSDGCSTGVARLRSSADLWQYATAVTRGAATVAVGDQRVAMPSPPPLRRVRARAVRRRERRGGVLRRTRRDGKRAL